MQSSNPGLQVIIDRANQVALPNQVPTEEIKPDETLLIPKKPLLVEQPPGSQSDLKETIRKESETDRRNARLSTQGLYGAFAPAQRSPMLDGKTLESQHAWEQMQQEQEDIQRRASIQNGSSVKVDVPPIKGLEKLASEPPTTPVPILDRVQSMTRSRLIKPEADRPGFVEPVPRRPSQTHSRKSSQALVMQSLPATEPTERNAVPGVSSAENKELPASQGLSPAGAVTTLSGSTSSGGLASPLSDPSPPHTPYPGKTPHSLTNSNQPQVEQKNGNAQQTASTECCCIL